MWMVKNLKQSLVTEEDYLKYKKLKVSRYALSLSNVGHICKRGSEVKILGI